MGKNEGPSADTEQIWSLTRSEQANDDASSGRSSSFLPDSSSKSFATDKPRNDKRQVGASGFGRTTQTDRKLHPSDCGSLAHCLLQKQLPPITMRSVTPDINHTIAEEFRLVTI